MAAVENDDRTATLARMQSQLAEGLLKERESCLHIPSDSLLPV